MEGFDKLVHELDDTALAGLHDAVSKETSARTEKYSLRLEDIHPNMTVQDRMRAHDQITKVLRGEE